MDATKSYNVFIGGLRCKVTSEIGKKRKISVYNDFAGKKTFRKFREFAQKPVESLFHLKWSCEKLVFVSYHEGPCASSHQPYSI